MHKYTYRHTCICRVHTHGHTCECMLTNTKLEKNVGPRRAS